MSEFDRIYNKKWEELVKGGVSTLDDPVSGVSEAHFQAYVYAEEITGIFVNLPLEAFVEDDGDQGWSDELYENMEFEKVDEWYGE